MRFIHNFGSSSNQGGRGGRRQQQYSPNWRQSVNANVNYTSSSRNNINVFSQLGGKTDTHSYSVQAGYSAGKGRFTDNLTLGWNRNNAQGRNLFTDVADVAGEAGIGGLPDNPRLWGLPDVTIPPFTGMTEMSPNFSISQTISLSDTVIWIHGKHNIRAGGDLRRVHNNVIASGNVTGNFTFTGIYTQAPGSNESGVTTTGSAFADFLLGLPQQTSLTAPYQTSYLRENAYDGYVQDDWRATTHLSLIYGVRYEYYSPYSEKYDHLATLDVGNNFASVAPVISNGVGAFTGKFPRDLIYPEHDNISPRIGFAANVLHNTIVRGGYGINYSVGNYSTFVRDFAFQPPFADVQTNEISTTTYPITPTITLANGFPAPQAAGNYAVNKHYRLPYVQAWSFGLQHTIPGDIVLNVGYNGTKGTRLSIVDAPGRTATESLSGVLYNYEDSTAFSNYNGLAVSARRRLHSGISVGGTYTYGHSIDDASTVGGAGGVVAQNWQDLLAEESNSSFDVRHKLAGIFLYELPFGPNTHLLTTGWLGHTLEGLSASGTFGFATGTPLTPSYAANISDVARGSTGSLRPDRVPGVSLTKGGGSLQNWFNKGAFANPTDVYGTASRNSIPSPGTVTLNGSLSKTARFAENRTLEVRVILDNALNIVQYSGVDTTLGDAQYGRVTSAGQMRTLSFYARYRF
jgi:hypothetical protein